MRSDKMAKEIKTMAAKKRLPKMETWERKMFVKGAPCEKGETSEKTGCSPRKGETRGEAGKEAPKKVVIKKAGTDPKKIESGEEEKGEKKEVTTGDRKKEVKKEARERQKKGEKAGKEAVEKGKVGGLDWKEVKEALEKKDEPTEEKKGVVEKAKVAGKKLGKIFLPKGGGKKLKWNGKVWTDGDQILAGTRSSGPLHGKAGRRVERATR
tara:strand:- start:236 stop:865 length:630 start_codon:yes stop_codon:yes gene_type:complete